MSEERIQRALAIFREVCELPAAERSSSLDTACGQDTELRAEVESMLAWDDTEGEDEAPHPVRAALADLAEQAESVAPASLSIPESVGGYRVTRLIAHGGMGVVYEARQENPERRVALKVARTGGTSSERARRFELEAQLLARLRHPGIAPIIESGTTAREEGAQPFFVMEYVEGQSLTDYANEHLPSARAKLELMASVCEVVAYAHTQGVVHRDLKPDNVLIEAGGTPKVLDFGVAKVQEAGGFGAATLRTEAGRVLGTMGYMAPEQLGGRTERLGPTADVYSLGVMIYELLTGRLPHELTAATLTHALAVVNTTDAPLLGVIRPEYRGDIEAVVAMALEKDPRYRYADAAALQADLERFLRDEPVLARRHSAFRRASKFARRHRALVGGATATIVALTLGLIAALYFLGRFQGKVREFNELAVVTRLANLVADFEAMDGLSPRNSDAMQAWLDECNQILELKDDIQKTVDGLGAREESLDYASDFLRDTLGKLLNDLEILEANERVMVEQGLTWARLIKDFSEHHPKWAQARSDIAKADNVVASALYAGQKIEFDDGAGFAVGLVPIGMNPQSKLWEFYHLRSAWDGTSDLASMPIPQHLPDGSIEMTASTGMVFVLIPGGTLSEESVPPFFLSKFEMTQGQWERCAGENPSLGKPSPVKPVNNVSWTQCVEITRRLGLVLPSDVQWEYATRAGTDSLWWTGDSEATLEGLENLFDKTAAEADPSWATEGGLTSPAPWRDERKQRRIDAGSKGDHGSWCAPVGRYAANPFGLYDVAGNVSEWCSSPAGKMLPRRSKSARHSIRGGNFRRGVDTARSNFSFHAPAEFIQVELGLRPAMAFVDGVR